MAKWPLAPMPSNPSLNQQPPLGPVGGGTLTPPAGLAPLLAKVKAQTKKTATKKATPKKAKK